MVATRFSQQGAQIVATRCQWYSEGLAKSGVAGVVSGNARQYHRSLASGPVSDLRLIYANAYNADVPGPNDITVRGAIELSGSVFIPAFFNGQRDATIKPGGFVISDPIGVDLAASTAFWSRTYVKPSASGDWPVGFADTGWWTSTWGELVEVSTTDQGDKTTSGTLTNTGGAAFGYGPCAIIGNAKVARPSVLIYGDSLMEGVNDLTTGTRDAFCNGGAVQRGFNNNVGWIDFAGQGQKASEFATMSKRATRMAIASVCGITHAVGCLGENDFAANPSTDQGIPASLLAGWTALANRGMKVWAVPMAPHGSPVAYDPSGYHTAANAYILTQPSPLSGVFNWNTVLSTDGVQWVVAYQSDQIHPNTAGHTAAASVFDWTRLT